MLKSGNTPLIRARNIERLLGISNIYLKLEGSNPGGSTFDRLAELYINDAKRLNKEAMYVRGNKAFITSMLYYNSLTDIPIYILYFRDEPSLLKPFGNASTIALRRQKKLSKDEIVRVYVEKHDGYLATEEGNSPPLKGIGLKNIINEITKKQNVAFDTLFMNPESETTVRTIYHALYKNTLQGKLSHFPKVFYGCTQNDYHHFKAPSNDKEPDQTFAYIEETQGTLLGVTSEAIKKSVSMLRRHEQLSLSLIEAIPFAAFIHAVNTNAIADGHHVIVLNDAKSNVQIKHLTRFNTISKDELIKCTRAWLSPYEDSIDETKNAIENAIERGYILLAYRHQHLEGITIIVHTNFEHFIPTYHLAYIGTDKSSKGLGVGTKLIQHAIDITEGNLSLHVDLDNKAATRIYRKMGFEHAYNRMLYKK